MCFTTSTEPPPWCEPSCCGNCSTTAYLEVAVVTSSLSFWVRTLNSWLKSTGRNRMITGILSILRRPWGRVEKRRRRRCCTVRHVAVCSSQGFGFCLSHNKWKLRGFFFLTFRQLRKLEVGGSERSSSLFWHCWKNRFRWGSWHRERNPWISAVSICNNT